MAGGERTLRMAITKIIAIRDRLDKRVNYAVNGEKTTLDTGITYATNPENGTAVLYVRHQLRKL